MKRMAGRHGGEKNELKVKAVRPCDHGCYEALRQPLAYRSWLCADRHAIAEENRTVSSCHRVKVTSTLHTSRRLHHPFPLYFSPSSCPASFVQTPFPIIGRNRMIVTDHPPPFLPPENVPKTRNVSDFSPLKFVYTRTKEEEEEEFESFDRFPLPLRGRGDFE